MVSNLPVIKSKTGRMRVYRTIEGAKDRISCPWSGTSPHGGCPLSLRGPWRGYETPPQGGCLSPLKGCYILICGQIQKPLKTQNLKGGISRIFTIFVNFES